MSSSNSHHHIFVPASTEYLSEVRDFVASYAQQFDFSNQQIQDIRLAVDEAYTNIIKHAYKNDATQKVEINLGSDATTFWISLRDSGDSFNTQHYTKPDLRERIKQKKRGGVGVYLIKELMDQVEYRKHGKKNEIIMEKKL